MNITHVNVKGLYGMFNHTIPLRIQDRITIIHGSNGLGKTALLKMINCLFNNRIVELRSIPFTEFEIAFDDESVLRIKRSQITAKIEKAEGERETLIAEYNQPNSQPVSLELGIELSKENTRRLAHVIDTFVPNIERIGPDLWMLDSTREVLTTEIVLERYWDRIPPHFAKEFDPRYPTEMMDNRQWFYNLTSQIDVRFIETQRLVTLPYSGRKNRPDQPETMIPAVARYSQELGNLVQSTFNQYASLSQSLDQSFPKRVINRDPSTTLSVEDLSERLRSLEKERYRLNEAGILDRESHYFEGVPTSIDDVTRNVLSVYAIDMKQKLSVFNDLTQKIELLKKFVKDHFLSKELLISREKGFWLRSTKTDKPLEAAQLSSGEQHELILFYELLFRLKPNSLILIDEPEISLHPDWQLQFLDDLFSIIKLTKFDVIIATHSPMIINQRDDLAEQLSELT